MIEFSKPVADEIEVSILGGGNGYGECIVIHLGFGHWIVIDSAVDPKTKKPLALAYFEEIEVDPSIQVKLILASHWHDDHVIGLAEIVNICPQASFACPQALEPKQFKILLGMYEKIPARKTGINEFYSIFHHLKSTKRKITRGIQDRVLWKTQLPDSTPIEVYSLSPSDEAISFFEKGQIKHLLAELESTPSMVIPNVRPNLTSIVSIAKIGDESICLGGDLENTSDSNMGWRAILQAQLVPQQTVSLFKVPHHGSKNAYCPEFWDQAMTPNPVAGLTPYARGRNKLPSLQDIVNIYKHTGEAYITAPLERGKEKARDPKAKKMIRDLGYDVREIPFSFGHIRLRKKIGQTSLPWRVDLRGKATELKNLIPPDSPQP